MTNIVIAAGAGLAVGLFVAIVLLWRQRERPRDPGFLEDREHWGGI